MLVHVAGDTARRRRYRRLQSWYRHEILGVPAGLDRRGVPRGNMLPVAAVRADPTLNFLRDPRLATIADDRIRERRGTVDADRLRRNLLSSQPLAVNLFGPLLAISPEAAAAVLAEALHIDMDQVSGLRLEWAPEPIADYLDDRTAFDVYFEFLRQDGATGFIGVETKYTDAFSPDNDIRASEAKMAKYRAVAINLDEYDNARIDELFHPRVSQLFRMALLASSWRVAGGFDFGVCLVAALDGDKEALEAVDRLSEVHLNPSSNLRHRTHDTLADAFGTAPELAGWVLHFHQRYLDTSPVGS